MGSTAEFLELTEPEATLVEMRIALASALRFRRVESRLTQAELAKRIGSSQSRFSKLEAAVPDVSLDLLVRSYDLTDQCGTVTEWGTLICGRTQGVGPPPVR